MSWDVCSVEDALAPTILGQQHQILASEIAEDGEIPVIDQGQKFIAGYTDQTSKAVTDDLPYIIFGDHTRCVKYVDFPFVLGADGTKVLKPKAELFDRMFFYF